MPVVSLLFPMRRILKGDLMQMQGWFKDGQKYNTDYRYGHVQN